MDIGDCDSDRMYRKQKVMNKNGPTQSKSFKNATILPVSSSEKLVPFTPFLSPVRWDHNHTTYLPTYQKNNPQTVASYLRGPIPTNPVPPNLDTPLIRGKLRKRGGQFPSIAQYIAIHSLLSPFSFLWLGIQAG